MEGLQRKGLVLYEEKVLWCGNDDGYPLINVIRLQHANALLDLETYAGSSDVNSLPDRHLTFLIFRFRAFVVFVRFPFACLLVVDRKI